MNQPDLYCVFGNPIAHSKSPDIHAAFAAATGQHLTYERRLAPLDGFAAAVRQFITDGGKGANVTVPFKLEAALLADRLSPRAEAAGAVNTLHITADGIYGDNTDGAGLVADIIEQAGVQLAGKRILLLGAGGAARGVILPLLERGPAQLLIANRTRSKADALVAQFAPLAQHPQQLGACEFEQPDQPFDLVINSSAASLAGSVPPIRASVFGPATLALDLMYGAAPTVFLAFAAAHGARTRDGLGMLVGQAAEAFALWRGVRPATADVLARLRAAL